MGRRAETRICRLAELFHARISPRVGHAVFAKSPVYDVAAAKRVEHNGFVYNTTYGGGNRANSAYRSRDTAPLIAEPDTTIYQIWQNDRDLDNTLAARGYKKHDETLVLLKTNQGAERATVQVLGNEGDIAVDISQEITPAPPHLLAPSRHGRSAP